MGCLRQKKDACQLYSSLGFQIKYLVLRFHPQRTWSQNTKPKHMGAQVQMG